MQKKYAVAVVVHMPVYLIGFLLGVGEDQTDIGIDQRQKIEQFILVFLVLAGDQDMRYLRITFPVFNGYDLRIVQILLCEIL